jgi:release factor glutamine methyltransferase
MTDVAAQGITIREALRQTQAALREAFVSWRREVPEDLPDREAEQLLEAATGMRRLEWITRLGAQLPTDAWDRLQAWTRRRAAGEPLQYIIGRAPFFGREFTVRPGCLIPRPETECLADAAIRWIRANRPNGRVVDLGTGSGILAITVALECPHVRVLAIDVSQAALAVARENADRLGARSITWLEADGRAWLREAAGNPHQCDVLVSNPPYIPSSELAELDLEVRAHEPVLALDGGPDGLDWYRAVCAAGPALFAEGPAALFLELGAGQADAVLSLFQSNPQWRAWHFAVTPDVRGIPRVLRGTTSSTAGS